jgi:hypothetical protein
MPGKQTETTTPDPFGFAPSWRPDQDDPPTLEGEFTNLDEGFSEYGSYPIVTITDDNGEMRSWHAMTDIAKAQLVKATPKIGERLKIMYGGKKASKNSSHEPYTRWRVENLSHPVTPEDLLSKYGAQVASNKPSGDSEFTDDPPF